MTIPNFDTLAFNRHFIGFDRMVEELLRLAPNQQKSDNYPPFNVIKLDDTKYVIEVAVAGFAEDELNVELKDNILTITGEQVKRSIDIEYLYRGISSRNFVRSFTIANNVEVRTASVKNGILSIALEMLVPEEKKAKKIAITFSK
jgi:molecular chaperone IbpA